MRASIICVVWLFAVSAIACGNDGGNTSASSQEEEPPVETVELEGLLKSRDLTEEIIQQGKSCYGLYGQYDGIDAGTRVTVRDQDGTIVGTGELEKGEVYDTFADFVGCEWPFTVSGLGEADFYTIEINGAEADYSASELESDDWSVKISI